MTVLNTWVFTEREPGAILINVKSIALPIRKQLKTAYCNLSLMIKISVASKRLKKSILKMRIQKSQIQNRK